MHIFVLARLWRDATPAECPSKRGMRVSACLFVWGKEQVDPRGGLLALRHAGSEGSTGGGRWCLGRGGWDGTFTSR